MAGADRRRVEVWSHRGRVDPATPLGDNTTEAVAEALRRGADGVEVDTWLCADGVFVLTHDRDTPDGPVDHCPLPALAHLDRLADLVGTGRTGALNIELKVPPDAAPAEQARLGDALASYLERTGPHAGVVVSSFSEIATRQVLASGLAVRTGHLCLDVPDPRTLERLAGDGYWGLHFLASTASTGQIGKISAAGLAAVAWTVNDLELAAGLVTRGVDVIISDTPVALQPAVLPAARPPRPRPG